MLEFNTIDGQGLDIINAALAKTSYYGSEYSYTYMCAWLSRRKPRCLKYAVAEDCIFITFQCIDLPIFSGEVLFLPPLATLDKIERAYEILEDYCKNMNYKLKVVQVPRYHAQLLDNNKYYIEFMPSAAEYLYSPSDIITLSGKKYHAKRNHISKFTKLYAYEFRDYTAADYDAVMRLIDVWTEQKDENAKWELYAIKESLELIESQNLLVGVLLVDAKVIGFSLGEITANKTAIVHYEKADITYDGAYSMLTNCFAKKNLQSAKIINRQEDMGIEGLRKSKQSYYPIGFSEKGVVTLK